MALALSGALVLGVAAPCHAGAMPSGLGSLGKAVRSPVIAVRSGKSSGTGLIVAGVVVGGALLFSLFTMPSSSWHVSAPPSRCWVITDHERGFGYWQSC